MDVEIIFVDDGSTDATRARLAAVKARDRRVRVIALTRNFGHQAALLAGMEAAQGDAVVSMDCDLQHPPALIPEMIAAWQAGAAVVETIRDDTVGGGGGQAGHVAAVLSLPRGTFFRTLRSPRAQPTSGCSTASRSMTFCACATSACSCAG